MKGDILPDTLCLIAFLQGLFLQFQDSLKVLEYYSLTAAFVIAVLVVFPTFLRGIKFVTVPP
jgi:hypothetical protein